MFKHFLEAAPPAWLVGFQAFRMVMELILWLLYKGGAIPVQMTPEGLNFDVLAGLTAPAVAYFCFVKKS